MDKEKTTWKELAENRPYYTCDGVRNLLVMRILKLSYWHLPDHLKPCFLSFGRFEEDNEISARTLMRLWIAEGFVHKEKEKSAENVAEEYLMELIDKSLVMVAKRSSDGGVKACVIHDLLLELCSEISKDENVVKFVNMKFLTIPKPMLPERRERNNSTADFLSESVLAFLAEIMKQRKWRYRYRDEDEEFKRRALHISIVLGNSSFFSRTCDMGKLPCTASFIRNLNFAESANPTRTALREVMASFAQELQEFLVVPRPDKFHESNNRIKKYQLLEAFISFLLQLLSHKTDPIINLYGDRIGNLEKELRFLHSILEDESLMVCADDEHIKFQELLAEFEDVANEAGRLVHSLFFTIHIQASREMDEGLAVVLNHIDLLKPNIMKFSNLLPSISRSAYITPKTSVLDSLRILDTLIYDLEDLIQEDNPIADVKDQIKILHQRLISLQSSIKQVRSQQPSQIVELREPLMRMGDMAHEAEYLIISYKAGDVPHWYVINKLTYVNHQIEFIGKDLHEIAKKYEFGGLEVVRAQPLLQAKRNNEVDGVTVGFEDKETDILDKLVGEGTEQLQVIAIFGMPGIGKTTLAKKLYNHPTIKDRFDRQSWCAVSQTYHRQGLLAGILTDLESKPKKDQILAMEEERLVETIYKTLKGRRYLVVMDDVWDSKVWDVLWRCFPDDGNGSKIMFTSRNKDVAPPNSIIYAQTNWSNDRCWELLEKRLFGNKPCPSELLEIGKRIAANCGGLPLAVVVIAGVLSTMDKEKTTWKEVEENLASYIFDGGDNSSVMQILELSYKHLPDHLKPCFLFFGRFEEDNEISARTLMRLWIAEGFVHKEKEMSVENVAEEYLMELIDKSLVMVARRRSDGGVKACVIHDLLLDLCKKISKDENFLKFVNIDYHTLYRGHQHNSPFHFWDTSPFYFWGTSPFYVRDLRILRVFFSFSRDHCCRRGIEYLVNLRYLIIEDLTAHSLPPFIGSLVNLEYLSVDTLQEVNLPLAILTMRKLRYLEVLFSANVIYEATHDKYRNSYQTINLEFLSLIEIRSLKDEEMLKCSPRLRKLKCRWITFSDTEERTRRNLDLSFLTQLELLNVSFDGVGELEEIRFPSNIRKLTLYGFTLSWEQMSIIGRLEKLELLKLEQCDWGKRWDTRDGEFQKLKVFKLIINGHLTEWNVESSQHFPMLQRLVLEGCTKLKEIPSEIGEIPTLQMIEVKGYCRKPMVESARRIQQEQSELGNEELRIIINPTYILE